MPETGVVKSTYSSIVLFDAVCPLCTRSARFIARNDSDHRFRFAALQSPIGRELARSAGVPEAHSVGASLALFSNGRWLQSSEAALEIAAALHPPWNRLAVLRRVPYRLRELVYRIVATHRPRRESRCVLGEDLNSRMIPNCTIL